MDLPIVLQVVCAYLIGTVCTGYLLAKWRKREDVRLTGSGGVGATNVGRLLGPWGFALTLIGDAAKGSVAVFLFPDRPGWILVAVIAGHIWPCFLLFRGGRGVATAIGGLLILDPWLLLPVVGGTLLAFPLLKSFTFSGLVGFLFLPIGAWLLRGDPALIAATVASTAIILFAHRGHLNHAIRQKHIH